MTLMTRIHSKRSHLLLPEPLLQSDCWIAMSHECPSKDPSEARTQRYLARRSCGKVVALPRFDYRGLDSAPARPLILPTKDSTFARHSVSLLTAIRCAEDRRMKCLGGRGIRMEACSAKSARVDLMYGSFAGGSLALMVRTSGGKQSWEISSRCHRSNRPQSSSRVAHRR